MDQYFALGDVLVWIMPTLSRPKQAAEVLKRIKESGCTSNGIVFLNDHSLKDQYLAAIIDLPDGWRLVTDSENIGAIGALNCIFNHYNQEPWYGFIADDEFLLPESPADWDQKLIRHAGRWNIAHGWESLHLGKRMQGYVVLGGDLVRAVSYLAIPQCWHWYGFDSMWEWLAGPKFWGGGEACQMFFVPEVRVEHRHAYVQKSQMDDCYKLGESKNEEDKKAFVDWITKEMPEVVKRVKEAKECASHT